MDNPTTTPCPHCGQPVRGEYTHCPFCGTDVATGERTEIVRGGGEEAGAGGIVGCLLSGIVYWFCGACYIIAGNMLVASRHGMAHVDQAQWVFWRTYGVALGFGVPIAVTGLLYLLLRRRFPRFARGLGYSCLVALVIALGAPFLCRR